MNKLQDRRKAAGFSQSQLAAKVPMSLRTLQHLERGSSDINKAAAITVWRLSCVLGCEVADLLNLPEETE
jgi:transcriptional regulator with XRE-family HTH domain